MMRYLSRGWRHISNYPVLIALPLVVSAVLGIFGIGVAGAALAWAMAGNVGRGGGLIFLLGLAAIVLGPAFTSGYNAMVGAAVRHEAVNAGVLLSNLGRYYWRVFGGVALYALAVTLIGFVFGRGVTAGAAGLAVITLGYFNHVWLAALVLRETTTLNAIGIAFEQLARRFMDYAPLLGISLAVHILVPELLKVSDMEQVVGMRSLLNSLIIGAATFILRVATFVAFADGEPAVSLD